MSRRVLGRVSLASWATALCVLAPLTGQTSRTQAVPLLPERLSVVQGYRGPPRPMPRIDHEPDGFAHAGLEDMRGMTIGPIESDLQPGRGYGSQRFLQTLDEVVRLGANWISLTVFARMWDKRSVGIDLTFERPYGQNRQSVLLAVEMAHQRGLRVLLVPHLWLESGEWRAEMEHGGEAFSEFVRNYSRFVLYWADVAEQSGVDLLSVGVELRSWVTTSRASRFVSLVRQVRDHYHGPLTYAANWDDAEDTIVWGELDLIGINAFYPLHWQDGASYAQVAAGAERVRQQVKQLAERYERPVLFTEFGYTARHDTEIKPWLWPEELGEVTRDEIAQARAYEALLDVMSDAPHFAGTFVWRIYADIADLSQEPDWGFSPWGKLAEGQVRRVYRRGARQAL